MRKTAIRDLLRAAGGHALDANAMAALERNPYLLSDSAWLVREHRLDARDNIGLVLPRLTQIAGRHIRDAFLQTFELSHNRDAGGHVFLPREKLLAAGSEVV